MDEQFDLKSPVGILRVSISNKGLRRIQILPNGSETNLGLPISEVALPHKRQLEEYFEGSRKSFTVPIDLSGIAPFYREVLEMVRTIPYGKTRTYKQIAQVLGKAGAVRAVGQANSRNPIPIVIPCHRVLGNNRELTGYAYGLDIKMKLLEFENPKQYVCQIDLFATSEA